MIYKRGRTPFWWADVTVLGERHRFSTKRTKKSEAKEVEEAFVKAKLDAGQLGAREMTLGEATTKYLERAAKLADYRSVKGRVDKLLGAPDETGKPTRWGLKPDLRLSSITSGTLIDLRNARHREGNAPGTINHEANVLMHILRLAPKWGANVRRDVEDEKEEVNKKLRWLTLDEERRLLTELDPARPYKGKNDHNLRRRQDQFDLVVFLLDTGARYSEIASITWDVIDTRGWRTINIYREKVGNEGILAMTDRLRAVLQRRRKEQPRGIYVFPSNSATGHRGYAAGGIRKAINRAGLNAPHLVTRFGKCTPHTFRDTFASRLVQAGVSLYKVQKLLGHATPAMTQKYAHLAPDTAAQEAADVLNQIQIQTQGAHAPEPVVVTLAASEDHAAKRAA